MPGSMEVDAGRGRNEVEGAQPLVLRKQKPRPRPHSVMVRIGAGPGIPSPSMRWAMCAPVPGGGSSLKRFCRCRTGHGATVRTRAGGSPSVWVRTAGPHPCVHALHFPLGTERRCDLPTFPAYIRGLLSGLASTAGR